MSRDGAYLISTYLIPFTAIPTPDLAPEYYRDYKDDNDFHLDDLGPGECAGTMIDLIENYLRTGRQSLEDVSLELLHGRVASATDLLKNGILRACHALLIPFGIDSPHEEETLKEFQHKVVEQGIVSERFEQFTEGLGKWRTFPQSTEFLQHQSELAQLFFVECKAAYDQMEASMKLKKSNSILPEGPNKTEPVIEPVVNSERKIDIRLDLAGVACPMNFVKTKLQLEEMETGQVLEVIIDDGAPRENVPRSVEAEGHKILDLSKTADDLYKLVIEKV